MNKSWPIVIYPEVAAAALKSRLHSAYAVFLVAKVFDTKNNGSGIIHINVIVDIAQKTLGISRSQAYRVIASGNGVFWRSPKNRIIGLYSYLRAYYHLGIEMFPSRPIRLTLGQMGYDTPNYHGSNIKDLMVCAVASWDGGQSPIAIETISELTGISERNIQRQIKYVMSSNGALTLNANACYRVKCDNIHQIEARSQVAKLNSRGAIRYQSVPSPSGNKYAVMERIGNTYVLQGVERLGKQRRHKPLKNAVKKRNQYV